MFLSPSLPRPPPRALLSLRRLLRECATFHRQRVGDERRVPHRRESRRRAEYAAPARGLRERPPRRRRHATRQHVPRGTHETSREGSREDLLEGVISKMHPARGDGGGERRRRERASDGDGVGSRAGVGASTAEEASEREGGREPGELGVAGRHAVGVAEVHGGAGGGRGCSKTRLRVCATISLTRMPARVRRSQSSRRARNAPRVATMMEIGTREATAMSVPTKSCSGYLSERGLGGRRSYARSRATDEPDARRARRKSGSGRT